jgi:hypothetical protein
MNQAFWLIVFSCVLRKFFSLKSLFNKFTSINLISATQGGAGQIFVMVVNVPGDTEQWQFARGHRTLAQCTRARVHRTLSMCKGTQNTGKVPGDTKHWKGARGHITVAMCQETQNTGNVPGDTEHGRNVPGDTEHWRNVPGVTEHWQCARGHRITTNYPN